MIMKEEKKVPWWHPYLYRKGDVFTGKVVPEANGILQGLLAEAERRERQRVLKIIKDKLKFDTNDDKFQFISELIDETL